jgi:hypothetical protein
MFAGMNSIERKTVFTPVNVVMRVGGTVLIVVALVMSKQK